MIDTKNEEWTGRWYRDNDPRSYNRRLRVLSEPDEKTNRVSVTDGASKTKIRIDRLQSRAYTRLPELEK